jgi:glyoxylase-like metal-dependent hydrolase (beta-lactamase superfamily II)
MAATVKILIEGYTNANIVIEPGQEQDCSTITLVRDGDLTIVADPGVMKDRQLLIDALDGEGLSADDIDVVCITHSHIDHYRNIGMFPNAKALEYSGIWDKDTVESWSEDFSPNVKILRTPGHMHHAITLLVTTDSDSDYPGVVAVCGDVFWKENYPEDPADDPFAFNSEELQHSREEIVKMADWIVPGHGPIYRTKKYKKMQENNLFSKAAKKPAKIIVATCRRCHKSMTQQDGCLCRAWLCFRCCECGLDCDLCSCSHKKE